MIRKIIHIDEERCDGCGLCMPNCPEGAIQMVNGKARLVSDTFCDGLGACLGHCPQGAITTEEREAEGYDERKVMVNILRQGSEAVTAHLAHLREHGEMEYLRIAENFLAEQKPKSAVCGCPGSAERQFKKVTKTQDAASKLTHWPVQLHLINPMSAHFHGADVLVAADCVAYSFSSFHERLLDGKKLTIFCPKLDQGKDIYREKVQALIEGAQVNTLTVAIMEVPCCGGMLQLVLEAARAAQRRVPIRRLLIGVEGELLSDDWVSI